jgi:N-acyl-D-aspartate/D-glutamate deacylase
MKKIFLLLLTLINFIALAQKNIFPGNQFYDLVILNGRVVDPEPKLDAICTIGISKGTIETITTKVLKGHMTINAEGLVVSPRFIDLHQHGQDEENYRVKAMDGVTTALELETGTADVDKWYAAREGKTLINYGVSVGHMPVRMKVMQDSGKSVPIGNAANNIASETELKQIKQQIEHGLKDGAVAVGFIVQFTPAASRLGNN